MATIKGTQTEKNLMMSFAGESQARMRYTYFASAAKKEGFEQIAAIFTETADQEKEHAKRILKAEWLKSLLLALQARLALQWRTSAQLLQVSMKSGLWTILSLLILQTLRVSLK